MDPLTHIQSALPNALESAVPMVTPSRTRHSSTVTAQTGTGEGYDIYDPRPAEALMNGDGMDGGAMGGVEYSVDAQERQAAANLAAEMDACRIEEHQTENVGVAAAASVFQHERTSAKTPAAKDPLVIQACTHKDRCEKHARSLMWACIFRTGMLYDSKNNWKVGEKMKKMMFSEAVVKFPPLDFIFATYRSDGFNEVRFGEGQGRALGVVMRWTLCSKLWQIRQESIPATDAETGVWATNNWLGAYTGRYSHYAELVHKHFDDAEHIERYEVPVMENKATEEHPDGILVPKTEIIFTAAHPEGIEVPVTEVKIRHKDIPTKGAFYKGIEEVQRVNIAHIKHIWLKGCVNMRKKAWEHLEKELTFLLRKILLIRDNRGGGTVEDKESNYFYSFGLDAKVPTTEELLVVPELELKSAPSGYIDRNRAALDKLSNKWGRFNVRLSYIGTLRARKVKKTSSRKRSAPPSSASSQATARRRVGSSKSRISRRESVGSVSTQQDNNGQQEAGDWLNDPKFLKFANEHKEVTMHQITTEKAKVPMGRSALTRTVSLHSLAVKILVDFTRVKGVDELLECHPSMLRAIHCCALGLSGLLRAGLGLPPSQILELEESTRGNIMPILPEGAENGIALFGGEGKRIPDFTDREKTLFFEDDHTEYVIAQVKAKIKAGTLANTGAAVPVGTSVAGNSKWEEMDPDLM